MDSPPECVLSLSCEPPQLPPTLPSLDHSPRSSSLHAPASPEVLAARSSAPSPSSPDTTPYFPLSPFDDSGAVAAADDDEENEPDGAPPSPTPAVALFPGGGGPDAGRLGSSPPATPSAPPLGFGALELALSSGQGGSCNDELDLQLFQRDTVTRATHGAGPSLRFPCHVCGKRFRFQSILSLHARAHSLDRCRRASALYRTAAAAPPPPPPPSLKPAIKAPQNHRRHAGQRFLPGTLIHHLTEGEEDDGEVKALDADLQAEQNPHFLLDATLTPPLAEDALAATPYAEIRESVTAPPAPAFRCHACKGKFRTASELARHVRILHNPYKCTLCAFSASQEEILASHLRECHAAPEEAPSLLPAFNSRPVVAAPDTPVPTPSHTPAPSAPPPPPPTPTPTPSASSPSLPAFRCDTCGQRFTQSWFLKGHMRKHKDSLDHKCQVCGRGFKEPWFLKNHMKVHLNKLGLKAGLGALGGPGGAEQHAKGSGGNHSLNALYSSLLLAQRGGVRGAHGRAERDGGRAGMSSGKSAILGYLGHPGDGGGASCMERLQAVAQVAEMGNGGADGGGRGGARGSGEAADGGDQAGWWQLVARSLAAAQQQPPPQRSHQRGHSLGPREQSRGSVITEAEQLRGFSGVREEAAAAAAAAAAAGGSWECPDCGKLFRSLQQVVVHARVHSQKHLKGEEEGSGGCRGRGTLADDVRQEIQQRGGGGGGGSRSEPRPDLKTHGGVPHQTGSGAAFQPTPSGLKGESGVLTAASSAPARERVRGRGIKDCPYCGKAFRSSHHLKVHLRVHTGERPYKCPHCDYAGTQSGSLKYHLQRHHREQRNSLSGSSSGGAVNSVTSGASKQRRSHANHCQGGRGQADPPPSSGAGQPSWLLGLPEQQEHRKALAALRDVDLETQYRYLSGVMGALYQGGVEGGWIRESPPPPPPPPRALKVSRRKPLTTSRMVPPGPAAPEPLDLSRRPSPGPAGGEDSDFGGGVGERSVRLSQCSECPFRTSSAELMAMHLQVNHTSKSRRKRGSASVAGDDVPKSPKLRHRRHHHHHAEADPLGGWRQEVAARGWSSNQKRTPNGFGEVAAAAAAAAGDGDAPDSDPAAASHGDPEDEEEEEESEENLGSSGPEDSPGLEPEPKTSASLSPASAEEERVPTN